MERIRKEVIDYIEKNIFPEYKKNEKAHDINHIKYVIERSFELIEENNGQLEQKMFVERNAQWMRRLPAMLHRAPSMVAAGLGHLHDRPTTPGLLSSLKTLGYTIEALAAPSKTQTQRP